MYPVNSIMLSSVILLSDVRCVRFDKITVY